MEIKYIYLIIGGTLIILFILYLCFKKEINFFIVAFSSTRRIQKNLYKHCKINDFLCMSEVPYPVGVNRYKYIDTIIIGNKYIYIIKQVKNYGEVVYKDDDEKWRVIHGDELTNIDNPLIKQRHIVDLLANAINGLEKDDFKTIVIFTNTCTINGKTNNINEYVVTEDEAFKKILEIEKESKKEKFSSDKQEEIADVIYHIGRKSEIIIKKAREK